jgi:hypothetical protein
VNTPWHDSEFQLKYQLGDYTLARKVFSVRQCEVGIGARKEQIDLPSRQDPNYQGFSVRGLPIDEIGKTLTIDADFYVYSAVQNQRYYLDLAGSFADYLSRFGSKTRSTLKRKVNKYAKLNPEQTIFKVYRTSEELLEFYNLARQVSSRTYQENLLNAGLPDDQDFIEELESLGAEDSARGFLLFADDRPVSYLYLSAIGKILIYRYLGYDPNYTKLSAGTVLHWYAIESLFEEQKFAMLDFTEGEGSQKKQFSTGSILCTNRLYLNKNIANGLFIVSHIVISTLSSAIGRWLMQLGVKNRIRKLVRFGFKST